MDDQVGGDEFELVCDWKPCLLVWVEVALRPIKRLRKAAPFQLIKLQTRYETKPYIPNNRIGACLGETFK